MGTGVREKQKQTPGETRDSNARAVLLARRARRGGVFAAAILRIRANILVDAALTHARAALRRHHWFVGEIFVEIVKVCGVFVRKALHVEPKPRGI